jgi:hypothetical protein
MHDIKYFFLDKNNQTIQWERRKKFQGRQLKKHYFLKFRFAHIKNFKKKHIRSTGGNFSQQNPPHKRTHGLIKVIS